MSPKKSTICIAEDRKACEPSLRLLLLSLAAHSPHLAVSLFYPPADDRFLSWLEKYPQVTLQARLLKEGHGWNIKPQAITRLLDAGHDEVIWIDSDILVTQDIHPVFSSLKSSTFVATEHTLGEERDDGAAVRARLWELPAGRVLPFALNSGVLRATKEHYHLMERWWELLQSDVYQVAQRAEWRRRPIHMLGDQDVLTALLTSKEFAEVPVHVLQRGKHIIQFDGVWGYTVAERIRNIFWDGPAFIHSVAGKPWSEQWQLGSRRSLRDYVKMVYLDVSPYTISAARFRQELGCDAAWMQPHCRLSAALRALGVGKSALVGLPMAIGADLARIAKHVRRVGGLIGRRCTLRGLEL